MLIKREADSDRVVSARIIATTHSIILIVIVILIANYNKLSSEARKKDVYHSKKKNGNSAIEIGDVYVAIGNTDFCSLPCYANSCLVSIKRMLVLYTYVMLSTMPMLETGTL